MVPMIRDGIFGTMPRKGAFHNSTVVGSIKYLGPVEVKLVITIYAAINKGSYMTKIIATKQANVLKVGFNRPEKKNSFTASGYKELTKVLEYAITDSEIRVVLLHGTDQVFSAGNDLGDFLENPPCTADAPVWDFLHALSAFPKPIVAAVCGPAVGIGTTMLLHCDLVYAGSNARFSLPFVNLGLCPEAASSLLLPRLFGYQGAAEALLTGDPFDAEFALKSNLVNRVLPVEEVLNFAFEQASKIAQKPLSAIAETKRLLKLSDAASVQVRINEEAKVFGEMVRAGAARESIAAFSEKRKPDFSKF